MSVILIYYSFIVSFVYSYDSNYYENRKVLLLVPVSNTTWKNKLEVVLENFIYVVSNSRDYKVLSLLYKYSLNKTNVTGLSSIRLSLLANRYNQIFP